MIDHDRSLDNFVPRFGLLSTTRITPIVLIGIWIIFLPATIVAAVAAVAYWSNSADLFNSFLSATVPLFVAAIGMVILFQTTRRYLQRNSQK
jgi:spore maturation protein SpmA